MSCHSRSRRAAIALLVASLALGTASAGAATTDLSFATVVNGTVSGVGPWMDLQIADTASADVFQFTLQASLTGSQNITGIFLSIPTAEAAKLTGVTVGTPSVNGTPASFVSGTATNATYSVYDTAGQGITGLAGTTGSKFDLYLKLPAGAISAATGGSLSETFTLSFAGADSALTATGFLTPSVPNNTTAVGGNQSPLAEIAMTNAGGTAGSGTGYITASAVPEPDSLALLALGLPALLVVSRRRRSRAA